MNETQSFVAELLHAPLEELLLPEDFGPEMDHPLLPTVLRRHNGQLPRQNVKSFVHRYECVSDDALRTRQLDIFALMDLAVLGDVVWEAFQQNIHRQDMQDLAQSFALPVDRCRVSDRLHKIALLELMDNFLITGEAPEDGLSGLACALLSLLVGRYGIQPMPVEQLLHIPGAARVLKTERPDMLLAWLEAHPDIPASQTLPLKALLDIRKEVAYEL